MRIGTFRSLTNPKVRYAIFRHGKAIKDHGCGVTWSCSCGHDNCKHLKCLWSYAKHNELHSLLNAKFLTLTQRGTKFFLKQFEKNL